MYILTGVAIGIKIVFELVAPYSSSHGPPVVTPGSLAFLIWGLPWSVMLDNSSYDIGLPAHNFIVPFAQQLIIVGVPNSILIFVAVLSYESLQAANAARSWPAFLSKYVVLLTLLETFTVFAIVAAIVRYVWWLFIEVLS